MEKWPSNCFAGRLIMGGPGLDPELNWTHPCPVPPECIVPTTVPLYFCVTHYDAVMERLYGMFVRHGWLDEVVAGPPDEFDVMMQRLRDEGQ